MAAIPIYSGYNIDNVTILLGADNTIKFAGLTAGTGISISGLEITNTGVTSFQGDTGAVTLTAGTGISISGTTISINTGAALTWSALQTFGNNISFGGATLDVSSLTSGDFLYYNGTNWINQALEAGTGISISGATITNSGVTSLTAGTGISVSASTGGVTITNAGVTSFQGDTGAITLTAGSGISISGTTISFSGSYTGNVTITGDLSVSGSFSTGQLDLTGSATVLDGTTAGTVTWFMPMVGTYYKKFVAYASGYENDSSTSQTITYSTAFTETPTVSVNSTGLSLSTSTSVLTIEAPDSTSTFTGWVVIEGY